MLFCVNAIAETIGPKEQDALPDKIFVKGIGPRVRAVAGPGTYQATAGTKGNPIKNTADKSEGLPNYNGVPWLGNPRPK